MLSYLALKNEIATGRQTPERALRLGYDQIERLEGQVGAFEVIKPMDTVLRERMPGRPMDGIAVGIKDIIDTHDLPTGYGSPIYRDHRPATDAAVVSLLRERGASIVGKTVTTEFAFFSPGKTVNPLHHDHTPGGSSSGSAAAVAAGMVPVAIGTQTGGSIIRPAAFCGVAGYKPSFRLVPHVGIKPFSWSLDTCGFFAASVRDVAAFAADLLDRDLAVGDMIHPPRIGVYRSVIDSEADSDMRDMIGNAVETLRSGGATITEVEEPDALRRARDSHAIIQDHEGALAMRDELNRFPEQLSGILRRTLADGAAISAETYDNARRISHQARKATQALFADVDVLISPSAPGVAPLGHDSTGTPVFNKLWTLMGSPCVNVPGLVSQESGLPLGLQVIGRFGNDARTLAAAAWIATALTGAP